MIHYFVEPVCSQKRSAVSGAESESGQMTTPVTATRPCVRAVMTDITSAVWTAAEFCSMMMPAMNLKMMTRPGAIPVTVATRKTVVSTITTTSQSRFSMGRAAGTLVWSWKLMMPVRVIRCQHYGDCQLRNGACILQA